MVEDAAYVRSKVQEQNASDSACPAHNFTIGRRAGAGDSSPVAASSNNNNNNNKSSDYSTSSSSSSSSSYPPAPTFPAPPAPVSSPPSSNPFGGSDNGTIQGVRQQSSAFTDDEGVGGEEDEEIEEV